jgi:competence protein ComEC
MDILNPPASLFRNTSNDINNNSLVIHLTYDEISFLLTADIQYETEYELISNRANLKSTVLKVPHHGSKTSTTTEFLAVVDPEIAVISVGKENRFNHPHQEVIERVTRTVGPDRILLTSQEGTVEFITDGQKLWIATNNKE